MERSQESVLLPRLLIGFLLLTTTLLPSIYSPLLSHLWTFLYNSRFYRFSGFETFETVLCYMIIEPLYTFKFGRNPDMRIDVRGSKHRTAGNQQPKIPKMRRPSKRMGEMFVYTAPLLLLDFTMIKKFAGVPLVDIRSSGGYPPLFENNSSDSQQISPNFLSPTVHNFKLDAPLQLIRALPFEPPSSRRLILELIVAFFLYDSLFFFIHVAFHRIPLLAKIHQPHHAHTEMHPQVTNKLSIIERLSLVLLANFSLNIIGSHVLTRTAFVPFFVYLLVDVHSGLDLAWGYDKIMPYGWGAGSKLHAVHHRTGGGGFAPFFGWWDHALQWLEVSEGKLE